MKYSTVYVRMDVHKETFSLCCYTIRRLTTLQQSHQLYRGHAFPLFICGYEAGHLGFTLYHQLTDHNVKCVILAQTTMFQQKGGKKVKTDKWDAALIARCLAHHDYLPVHIPTDQDEQTKEFICIRDDHKLALKKVK